MGLLERLVSHGARVAITAPGVAPLSYRSLLGQSQRVARDLQQVTLAHPPQQVRTESPAGTCESMGRVPLLAPGGPAFVSSLLGTWMAGMASVPLCTCATCGALRTSPHVFSSQVLLIPPPNGHISLKTPWRMLL